MKQVKAKIISNQEIAPERFLMRLATPGVARIAKPGQFVMVKCSADSRFMLRRPFAFHRIRRDFFDILYQMVGEGTELLSRREKGDTIDIIGPLGNGFSIDKIRTMNHQIILVAGGIAVAPLLALAETLAHSGKSIAQSVIIGARIKNHILCVNDFKKLGFKVEVATEDGSMGHKGLACDLLKTALRNTHNAIRTTIYACGPKAMLKEVANVSGHNNIHCEVSLEEKMACGMGVCFGCAVKTKEGYKQVCKDGPVFDAREIVW